MLTFTATSRHPSAATLIPVAGTVLVIIYSHSVTWLKYHPLVWTGLISYSLYLWHLPLFAFYRHLHFGETTGKGYIYIILISFILAVLTWLFIERPFRNSGIMPFRLVATTVSVSGVAVLAAGVAISSGILSGRSSIPDIIVASFSRDESDFGTCMDNEGADIKLKDWFCVAGPKNKPLSYFVVGDSHAWSLFPAFRSVSNDTGIAGGLAAYSACPPLLGIYPVRADRHKRNCHTLNERVFSFVREAKIKTIFLVARWAYYSEGNYAGADRTDLTSSPMEIPSFETTRSVMAKAMGDTVRMYASLGVNVIIVSQAPMQKYEAREIYAQAYQLSQGSVESEIRRLSVRKDDHLRLQDFPNEIIHSAMKLGATVLDLTDLFCDTQYCPVGTSQSSFYLDGNHLNVKGSLRLSEPLKRLLSDPLRQ